MSGDRTPAESRDLRCPNCDYDLHGQRIAEDDVLRCPECGAVTDLDIIAATLVHRRRRSRRLFGDLMIALGLLGAAVIFSLLLGDALPRDEIAVRVRFLFSGTALAVSVLPILFFYFIATWMWDHLSRLRRLGFAAAAVLIVMLVPLPFALFAFIAWLIGFHVWAMRQI